MDIITVLAALSEIEQLKNTVKQSKQSKQSKTTQPVAADEQTDAYPFSIGDKIFIRTVTYAHTGRVKAITGDFVVLEEAAWIADTGRFAPALANTEFDEIEPFTNDVYVNMKSLVDVTKLDGELPTTQK